MANRRREENDLDLTDRRLLTWLGNEVALSAGGDLTLGQGNCFDVDTTLSTTLNRIYGSNWRPGSTIVLRPDVTLSIANGVAAGSGFLGISTSDGTTKTVQAGSLASLTNWSTHWILHPVGSGGSTGPWEQVLIDPRGTFTTTANLIENPGFEDSPILWIQGDYSAAYAELYSTYPGMFPDGNPESRELKYAVGGPYTSHTPVTLYQEIDVSTYATEIDSGKSKCTAMAWLGGFLEYTHTCALKVTFREADETPISDFTIGPVTAGQRGGVTCMLKRKGSSMVPIGTRNLLVELVFTWVDEGVYDVRAYADNVSVTLTIPDEPELARDLGTVVSLVDASPATAVLSDWQYTGSGWSQIWPGVGPDNGQSATEVTIDGGVLDIGSSTNVVAMGAGPLMWIEKADATSGVTVISVTAGEANIRLATDASVPSSRYGYLVFPGDEVEMQLREGYEARFRCKGTHWLYIGGTR